MPNAIQENYFAATAKFLTAIKQSLPQNSEIEKNIKALLNRIEENAAAPETLATTPTLSFTAVDLGSYLEEQLNQVLLQLLEHISSTCDTSPGNQELSKIKKKLETSEIKNIFQELHLDEAYNQALTKLNYAETYALTSTNNTDSPIGVTPNIPIPGATGNMQPAANQELTNIDSLEKWRKFLKEQKRWKILDEAKEVVEKFVALSKKDLKSPSSGEKKFEVGAILADLLKIFFHTQHSHLS